MTREIISFNNALIMPFSRQFVHICYSDNIIELESDKYYNFKFLAKFPP